MVRLIPDSTILILIVVQVLIFAALIAAVILVFRKFSKK